MFWIILTCRWQNKMESGLQAKSWTRVHISFVIYKFVPTCKKKSPTDFLLFCTFISSFCFCLTNLAEFNHPVQLIYCFLPLYTDECLMSGCKAKQVCAQMTYKQIYASAGVCCRIDICKYSSVLLKRTKFML